MEDIMWPAEERQHLRPQERRAKMKNIVMVTRSSMPEFGEYTEEIREVWDTHWMTNMGVKHQKLQEELKKYLGVERLDLFTNGHMALELSLQALNLRGEVITLYVYLLCYHPNGLEPVFCDIDPETFTINADMIEELITDRTSAIVPVHVYGNLCEVEKIKKIADKYGLKVSMMPLTHLGSGIKGREQGILETYPASAFTLPRFLIP